MTVVKTDLLIFSSLRGRSLKGKGKGIRAQDNAPHAPRFPLPLPLLTPTTQAKHFQTNLTSRENQENIKALILKNLDS